MTKQEWIDFLDWRQKDLMKRAAGYTTRTWEYAQEPFHIIDNLYYVGTKYVSCLLFDTGCGLILMDPGFNQTAYQVVNNIYKLGFDPRDIKKILLTHGHFDHLGATRAIQEVSGGAEIYLGERDLFFLTERRDLIMGDAPEFTVDHIYKDDEPIVLGNTVIHTVSCPGHTPGTTSFFYTFHHNGREYIGATHGGLGLNGLTKKELAENRLPEELQQECIRSLKNMMARHVDVTIPSHNHNSPQFLKAVENGRVPSPEDFIDASRWQEMIGKVLDQMEDLTACGL